MSWRAAGTTLTLAASLALAGCANLVFFTPKPVAVPAADDAEADATKADRAQYGVEIVAPEELQPLLKNYLDLSRFQNAPAADRISASELDRLIAAAPAQARALLETEGYFDAGVRIARDDSAAAAVVGTAGQPTLRVLVVPGVLTRVADVTLNVSGPLQDAVNAGDPQARAQLAALRAKWALPSGEAFRQSAWNSAKLTTLANLRADGYAAADWKATDAQVDVAAHGARLTLELESGPQFKLGALKIEGLERHAPEAVGRLATFVPGTVYSEKLLFDFQERLQQLGLFEGANVDIDPDPAQAGAVEVRVRVKELPLQQATVGVGYSANTGPRLTLEHTARRVFDLPWIAKNKVELGPDHQSWTGDLTSHPLDGRYRNLIGGSSEWLRTGDEERTAWSARIGRTQDTSRIERLYYLEYANVRLETLAGTFKDRALSYNYQWVWRDLDSVLLPTRGASYSAQGAVGYARSDTKDNGPFGRAYGRATWYLPLGAAWYSTTRLEAGQVYAASNVGVPDTLLFRAGGDESVRGYAYRTLGPTLNGAVTSGRMLFAGSVEVARPISPNRPALWWALFVDSGNAANAWNELTPALGYGAGLRWRSPVGPLRVDLAYGQEVKKARLHLSVGIAF